jgi:septal ring factor EnvC (AmiA/AmiB activator)
MVATRLCLLAGLTLQPVAARDGLRLTANPIRRVVTMLQQMQNKITAEGKKEEALFEKFMCYCKNGVGDLEQAIDAAETKIPQLEADIKALDEALGGLHSDVEQAKKDREEAKAAMATATALREKEAAVYAKVSGDYKTNVAAMKKAIAALEKGVAGAFLQTTAASIVRKISLDVDMSAADRDVLSSFLSEKQTSEYAPQSGEIIGILKQMLDTMEGDLADTVAAEEKAIANYDALMKAKTEQVDALTKEIEDKLARIGDDGVRLSEMKEDLEDTKETLAEDKAFLAQLEKDCATKQDEWDARCKTRTDELLALADTVKILNDDDALELFKKTLPAPSLIELKVTVKQQRAQAVAALGANRPKDSRLDLIALALKGKKVSFDKVIKMIDDMVALLADEQKADDDKKEECEKLIDEHEDKHKELNVVLDDLDKEMEETKEMLATTIEEIKALTKGIKDLDNQVEDATYNRKEEHEDYVTNLAANKAALELLGFAKNRLNTFYNPKLYKAPPKRNLSEEERITVNMGGTLAPTAAPGGIAGTGVTVLAQGAPPPPPETWGAYKKKGQESNGVITMIGMLEGDLDKEITEMEFEEKDSQKEYEQFIADSKEKRQLDSKSLTDKEAAKADAETSINEIHKEMMSKMKENMATVETLKNIHLECDWLLQNFDYRKEARAGEVESLKNAKAVLSGADYSLVEVARIRQHIQ